MGRVTSRALLCVAAVAAVAVAAVSAQVVPDSIFSNSINVGQQPARSVQQLQPGAAAGTPAAATQLDEPSAAAAEEPEEDEAAEAKTRYWIYTHAVLMSLAWVGLLPRECVWFGGG